MSDGFGVGPDDLRRAAAQLRADAASLDSARASSVGAAVAASGSGEPALGEALENLASQLDRTLGARRTGVEEAATALEASATDYLAQDQATAGSLGGIAVPGVTGPP